MRRPHLPRPYRFSLLLVATTAVFVIATVVASGAGVTRHGAAATASSSSAVDRSRLPLGDAKLTTSGARRGYLWACNAGDPSGPGAGSDGPWINTAAGTFDETTKAVVDGSVSWPAARVRFHRSSAGLRVTTTSLPVGGTTGTFPIRSSDDAYRWDRNPSTIRATSRTFLLPVARAAARPSCVAGEVGVALDGVSIFDAADATGRDAVAHEAQDSCDGHPQDRGIYHYHQMPYCRWKDASTTKQSTQFGWAFDGYPIFGPRGPGGRLFTNADLDACHGLTSTVVLGGRTVRTYHYVATLEYPYTVGCFHGTPLDIHRAA